MIKVCKERTEVIRILELIAFYIFIFILLFAFGAIPFAKTNITRRSFMAGLSLLDIAVLLAALAVRFDKLIFACISVPLVVFFSSLYDIRQEKKHSKRQVHFQLPSGCYQIDRHLTPRIIKGTRMKSTTGVLWEGKLIIMPQPFVCDGEALDIICRKSSEDPQKYFCSGYSLRGRKRPVGEFLLSASILVFLMGFPVCFYLGKGEPEGFWMTLGSRMLVGLVFGFGSLTFYGKTQNRSGFLMKLLFGGFYFLSIAGVFLSLAGF